jgi:hypothetical protein
MTPMMGNEPGRATADSLGRVGGLEPNRGIQSMGPDGRRLAKGL